jgi:hypothetical protein
MQGLDSGWRLASFFLFFFFFPTLVDGCSSHSFSSHSLGLILRAVCLIPNPQTQRTHEPKGSYPSLSLLHSPLGYSILI